MSKMIGLTGGIGAGKTMVAKIFENLGVPVFNADDTAKQLMQTSPEIKTALKKQFERSIMKLELCIVIGLGSLWCFGDCW